MGWIGKLFKSLEPGGAPAPAGNRTLDELAQWIGLSADALLAFTPQYQEAFIPKRAGGKRRLLVPDRPTKGLQRAILHRVLRHLRAHEAACGFEPGRSIVHNALPHAGQAVVVRLDVVDFFSSTTAARVEEYFRRIGWNADAAAMLAKLTTHAGGLPQGAPTSPRLSNLVNFQLDVKLARLAARRRGRYTRYADDITISFPKDYPRHVRGLVQRARAILRANGYTAHKRKKLSIRRRHQRQQVTGLVVNVRPQLARSQRRRLRAALHYQRTGRQGTFSPAQLAGWQALQAMIDRQSQKADGA